MLPRVSSLLLLLLAIVCCGGRHAVAVKVLSLDGEEWTVRNANGSIMVPAKVPGGIYTDLRTANVLTSDFFYGSNDELQRWVSYDNWTYERSFEADASLVARRHAQLVLHGADTVAEVWLNGRRLGAVDNMFVRYSLPLGDALREGVNRLAVNFTSSPLEALRRYEAFREQHGYDVPPACVPEEYHGECHANHLRKMQASFSWDWGPAFPSEGLWKSVAVEAFDVAVLRDFVVRFEERSAALHVRAFLEAGPGAPPQRGTLEAELQLPGGAVRASAPVRLAADAAGECVADITISGFDEPPRWWPNGEGDQPLLPLTVSFVGEREGGGEGNVERSSVSRRIAYRTVELVQEPVANAAINPRRGSISQNDVYYDQGLTFYFRVNGRPVFAKGSNWIPASVLPELGAAPATLRHLLTSARDTHMNMLRVWGGGVYESDLFYELADELGILIWQDLMFACSMYPADAPFLASVSTEVRQQLRRLQTHASVALWAGNNENEGALVNNWYGTSSNYYQYKKDYVTLYAKTIRQIVLEMDPTREFVVSSPSNGLETDKEGYVSNNPSSPHYGDIHYYNYFADAWNPDTFPTTRFASEYGFQSLPSLVTLEAAGAAPGDLAVESDLMQARQHHPNGYEEMVAMARKRLPVLGNWDTAGGFEAFVFLTQIHQAMATQTETEHYRRLRSQITITGEGLCMGALYWQLNDVWQAPTWSSIDFEGRWKPLHHLAEEFFAPQLLSPYVDTAHRLHVWALNDGQARIMALQLQGRAGTWSSFTSQESWSNVSDPFDLEAACSQRVLTVDVGEVLAGLPGCGADRAQAPQRCFLELRLLATADGALVGPTRAVLPVSLAKVEGMDPANVRVASVTGADGSLEVRVEADRPAAFVWLEAATAPGRFSRNAFLLPEATTSLRFLPLDPSHPPTAQELARTIRVTSLADILARSHGSRYHAGF